MRTPPLVGPLKFLEPSPIPMKFQTQWLLTPYTTPMFPPKQATPLANKLENPPTTQDPLKAILTFTRHNSFLRYYPSFFHLSPRFEGKIKPFCTGLSS
jgi:hypothetical protein